MIQEKNECIEVKKNNPQAETSPTTPRITRLRRSRGPRLPVIALAIRTVILDLVWAQGIYSLFGGLARGLARISHV
jgi:hypothetical protein